MAEIKKISGMKSWSEGQDLVKNARSYEDFNASGIPQFKPTKGEKFTIANPQVYPNGVDGNGKPKGYSIVECYKGTEFVGYMTFRKLYGYDFQGVVQSERTKAFYAKNEAKNAFVKQDATLLGVKSLGDKLATKEFSATCTDTKEQQIPEFGANLAGEYKKVNENVYFMDIN